MGGMYIGEAYAGFTWELGSSVPGRGSGSARETERLRTSKQLVSVGRRGHGVVRVAHTARVVRF